MDQPRVDLMQAGTAEHQDVGMTQFKVLRTFGYWTSLDTVVVVIFFMSLFTIGSWNLFGSPGTLDNLAAAVGMLCFLVTWVILLIFRTARFILEARAEINTMPEVSARIAVAYLSGTKPPQHSKQ